MDVAVIYAIRFLGVVAFAFLMVLLLREKRKPEKIEVLILLITLWVIIITLIGNVMTSEILYLIYLWSSTCIISYNFISKKDSDFLTIFCILSNIYVLLNIPFMFMDNDANAYERIYIFGGKNTLQMHFIPAIFANYIVSYIKHGKLKSSYLVFIVLDILTVIMCGASTGIFAVIAIIVFAILSKKITINIWTYIVLFVIFLVLIFNTQRILEMDMLYDFITNTLGKDLSFTTRTDVWKYVVPNIFNNFFGYGYGNLVVYSQFSWLNEAHNMFLELLLIGGVPLLVMYCVLLYELLKKNPNKTTNLLLAICFSFFVIGLMESIQFHSQFWILLIAYYKISNGEIGYEHVGYNVGGIAGR